jgi:hypothetical protein
VDRGEYKEASRNPDNYALCTWGYYLSMNGNPRLYWGDGDAEAYDEEFAFP